MRKSALLVAAALLVPAAQAQAWGPYSVCAPGAEAPSYHACASATVTFAPDAEGGIITLQVKNTGLWNAGVLSHDWGYGITGIGITAPTIADAEWLDVSGTEEIGDAASGWKFSQQFMGFNVQAGAETKSGMTGAIWGCYGNPGSSDHYETCDAGEFVTFRFRTSNSEWNEGDVAVSFAMRGQSGYEGDSYRCSDDPTANNGNGGCDWGDGGGDSTVPEPVSLVLLGSGLLGLAGVRSRRRE